MVRTMRLATVHQINPVSGLSKRTRRERIEDARRKRPPLHLAQHRHCLVAERRRARQLPARETLAYDHRPDAIWSCRFAVSFWRAD